MNSNERIHFLFSKYTKQELFEDEFNELIIRLSVINEEEIKMFSTSLKNLWEKIKSGRPRPTVQKVNWERLHAQDVFTEDNFNNYFNTKN